MGTTRIELESSLTNFREYLFPTTFVTGPSNVYGVMTKRYKQAQEQGIWDNRIGAEFLYSTASIYERRFGWDKNWPLPPRYLAKWQLTEEYSVQPRGYDEYKYRFEPLQLYIKRGLNQSDIREMIEELHLQVKLAQG